MTVRDSSRLIGVLAALIDDHLNLKECHFASPSIYYIRKEYRGKGVGKALFTTAERCLKTKGVTALFCGTKTYLPHDPFFIALGYTPVETVYMKVLT